MGQYTTTGGGYTLKWVEPDLIDKIADSATATEQVGAKMAGAAERLYVRNIVVTSPDATDTNNITIEFFVITGDAASDGAADTSSITTAEYVGGTYFDTGTAGNVVNIPVDFLGDAGEDLVCDITVAAGTPTVKYVVYYKLIT
jgi:hypothetical protein